MSIHLPETIGSYRIERLLGRGGMGEVYLARDRRLNRRVAIKRVRPDADNPVARARLRREARAAAHLSHSNIVQIFELLETEAGDWIVQEFVEGTTVAEHLSADRIDNADLLTFSQQIVAGLAEAHRKGILHRDLKTTNVMVTPSGNIKILDFGLAKQITTSKCDLSISTLGQVVGTSYAMSPEQARGLAVDFRSDLFSLGSLLYEMATGVAPFRGDSLFDTLSKINSQQPVPIRHLNSRLSTVFSDLVERLLAKAPELRPANADEVATILRRLVADVEPSDSMAKEPDNLDLAAETLIGPAPHDGRLRGHLAPWLTAAGLAVTLSLAARYLPSSLFQRAALDRADSSAVAAAELSTTELYELGMASLRRFDRPGNITQARAAFQRMLALEDSSAAAYSGLARTYWQHYQYENLEPVLLNQALAAADQAVGLDEYFADARVSRGLVYLQLGRTDDAAADLREALALDPTQAEAFRGLGELYESQGDLEAAEVAFHSAIELDPDNRIFHDILGALYFRSGRYEAAEAAFRSSIAAAPDCIFGYRNLASTYYFQGRLGEASAELQKALRIRPSATLYSSLGTIFFSQGLYEKAAAAFEKSLSTGGNNHIYWSNLADAYRQISGSEANAREAFVRAEQLLSEQIAAKPDQVTLRSRRAVVLAKLGEHQRALAELSRIATIATGDLYTQFRSAVSYEICGDRESALKQLEAALRAGFSLSEVRRDPELLALRADPQFHRLLVSFGADPNQQDRPASPGR